MLRPESTRVLPTTAGTQAPETEAEQQDRFRIRRSLALVSAGLLSLLALLVLIVVLGGTEAMAERLNTVQGFAGVIVTALVTIIMGYGVNAYLDDKNRLDRGQPQPRYRTHGGGGYQPAHPERSHGRPPMTDDPLASAINSAGRAAAREYSAHAD